LLAGGKKTITIRSSCSPKQLAFLGSYGGGGGEIFNVYHPG